MVRMSLDSVTGLSVFILFCFFFIYMYIPPIVVLVSLRLPCRSRRFHYTIARRW
ncbi:uncharacterized protein BDV14DRAFT_93057 [Aspergillus stella-maris]|uniref:uncharacterized protein n=1 Tax=Aspergillus stella-maris TaxID=1810926 RepID=UPI003CCD40C2